MAALRRERGGWATLLETLKDMYRKALEMGSSLHRGHVGEQGGGSFTVDLSDGRRRSLVTERLSVAALLGESGGRAPLLGNLKDICIMKGISRHRGTVRELGGGLDYRDFDRALCKQSFSSMEPL